MVRFRILIKRKSVAYVITFLFQEFLNMKCNPWIMKGNNKKSLCLSHVCKQSHFQWKFGFWNHCVTLTNNLFMEKIWFSNKWLTPPTWHRKLNYCGKKHSSTGFLTQSYSLDTTTRSTRIDCGCMYLL